MRSWLQLRTVPTYHAMHMDTCEESSTSHTNGADTKYVSSYSDDVPDNLRRTEKLSSPSSSELSMQSVISIKINDEDDERKSREFDPDCADNVRGGHHGARVSNTDLPPFSRSLISTPSTPVDRTLSNQGLTPAELNTLISPTSNVIKRSRPVPSRTPQRPLSMNVECATARPNILRLPRQQLRTVKTDVATQTDEIPSLNGAQNRSAEPEFGPDADAMVTMSKVKNGTLVDSTETLSPVETWPLSIQSIVKPAEFPRIFLPTTFNNPNLSAKDDESEACLSVSSSQEVKGVAATFYTNPNEGWNVASSGLSRRSSLAGPCQTSTNALRPPVSRAPALMRQTRFPNGIHKFDSTNAESHRCRSVHFSTDVLVAHTGLGPAPLMLSSAPLKEAALPPFDCAHQSVDPERISSRRARRSSSVSMLISTNPNSNSFDSHRTYVPTTEPCLVSPLSPIRRQ
ncbi:unnamed protein product [Dicrocoelium dendriticum]|nr:unnamed protein product [Dicrocoelium dendriticum]